MAKTLTLDTVVETEIRIEVNGNHYVLQTPSYKNMMVVSKIVQEISAPNNLNRAGTMLRFIDEVIRLTDGTRVPQDETARLIVATGGYAVENQMFKLCLDVCGFSKKPGEEDEDEEEAMELAEDATVFTE